MADGQYPRYAGFGYRREFAMTPSQWAAASDPVAMLRHLGADASPRKLRLFAVCCFRHVWSELGNRARVAVKVAEQFADGQVSRRALARENAALRSAAMETCATDGYALAAAQNAAFEAEQIAAHLGMTTEGRRKARTRKNAANAAACVALRDIFTPLGHPASLVLSSSSAALAQAAYEQRLLPSGHLDIQRLAILADAVEEAGCADHDLLHHLRSPGPHVARLLGRWTSSPAGIKHPACKDRRQRV